MPKYIVLICLLTLQMFAVPYSQTQGWCEQGAKTITVGAQTSSTNTPVQRSFPRCKVTVYLAGTVTPASLFSTNTGTVLTNPFSADVNGYWAFFTADGTYDIMFSAGSIPVPFTQGAHTSIDPYFESGITGYVSRLKNAKLADVVSIKDFGAVGDGTTDDTAAIAAAMTWTDFKNFPSTSYKCVYFPTGTYTTTTGVLVTHQVCITGDPQWRLKYTGSGTVTDVFKINGGPADLPHTAFLQGSFIEGMVIDGNGKATNGLTLQAIVSAQMNYIRATNVTGIGINVHWGQQIEFEHAQVSSDFEPFSTTPTNCVVLDGTSSANVFYNLNCDHVSGDGVLLTYGLNSTFTGGTSEGNGGWGVNCPSSQCFNNTFTNFDIEVNGLSNVGVIGDYRFGSGAFFNTILSGNSFSNPGVQFEGSAHNNTIIGGQIGGGSNASINTFGNRLFSVSSTTVGAEPIWTDLGQNCSDRIYDIFHGTFTEPACYFQNTNTVGHSPGGTYSILTATPADTHVYQVYGNTADNWIGFDCQLGFPSCWLTYGKTGGMQFMGEDSPNTGAVNDGAIKNHKWCFGTFCQTPVYTFHFNDGISTHVAIQVSPGQGGTDLLTTYALDGTTVLGSIKNDGTLDMPIAGALAGQALCKRSNGKIGQCTSVVNSSGACTCAP